MAVGYYPTNAMKAAATDSLQWERMFKVLRYFIKAQGHCDVPPNPDPGSLGHWLAEQRTSYRVGLLTADQIKRLEKIGFLLAEQASVGKRNAEWRNERWEYHFAKLLAYKKRFGHCVVQSHWEEDRCFGHWVSNQRIFRRKGLLSQERIDRLEQLGFKWVAGPHRLEGRPRLGRMGHAATPQSEPRRHLAGAEGTAGKAWLPLARHAPDRRTVACQRGTATGP
jgi:hypothetical protein